MHRNQEARSNVANLRKQLIELEKEVERLGLFDQENDVCLESVYQPSLEENKMGMLESAQAEG